MEEEDSAIRYLTVLMENTRDSHVIKSSDPQTTDLCSSKAQAMGNHTPWLQIPTQLLQKGARKKLSNLAFSAFDMTSQKELQVLRKALWQVKLLQGSRSNFALQTDPKGEPLATNTTRSSLFLKRKENQTPSKMPQISPQGRGRAGLTPMSQPTPPPPQPRQNPPLAIGVAVDLSRAPGTSHIYMR